MERRGILLLTVVPVIAGLVLDEAWAVSSGFITLGALAPVFVGQAMLVALFVYSYLNSRSVSVSGSGSSEP